MKTILALVFIALSLPAQAAVLAGPIVNPANGHTYYLLSSSTWTKAEAEAVRLGGHLVTIRNPQEDRWIFSTFGDWGGGLWIGLTDRQKTFHFTWVSGEPVTYTNWSAGQPDNGTGGIEFYVHMWPKGHEFPGQWNDYADRPKLPRFPLYGVAETCPASTVRLPLSASPGQAAVETPLTAATQPNSPRLHAFTAIELTWSTETNRLYQIQWSSSPDQAQWIALEPTVLGTGTNVSFFDSTRDRPHGFYRVQIVQ